MPRTKEQMREYQAARRAQLKGEERSDTTARQESPAETLPPPKRVRAAAKDGVTIHLHHDMAAALDKPIDHNSSDHWTPDELAEVGANLDHLSLEPRPSPEHGVGTVVTVWGENGEVTDPQRLAEAGVAPNVLRRAAGMSDPIKEKTSADGVPASGPWSSGPPYYGRPVPRLPYVPTANDRMRDEAIDEYRARAASQAASAPASTVRPRGK